MKIQIDTDLKLIDVLEVTNFSKLERFLKEVLKDDYEKYSLEATDNIYTYPIVYPWIVYPYYQPTTWPTITCSTGTYNLEIQDDTTIT